MSQVRAEGVSTNELWARLFQSPDITRFFAENGEACDMPSLSQYITKLCEERGEKPEHIIKLAGLERSYGHRVFSGARNPSRDTVLQLAFGFGLTTDETQQLLKVAQASPLHPKVKRDAVIAYCIHGGASFMEVQQTLHENGFPLLGGRKRA